MLPAFFYLRGLKHIAGAYAAIAAFIRPQADGDEHNRPVGTADTPDHLEVAAVPHQLHGPVWLPAAAKRLTFQQTRLGRKSVARRSLPDRCGRRHPVEAVDRYY